MDDDDLLPIGRFARLSRLSVKQLRHYDALGLLRPARVDAASGYRLYRRGQARDALSIALLRSLDVPLVSIARVLRGDDVPAALGEVRDRLESDLAARRRRLAALERILHEGLGATDVTVVEEEPRHVLRVGDVADTDTVGATTSACVAALTGGLAAAGIAPDGPLLGLFPLDLGLRTSVTLAAPVPEGTTAPGLTAGVLPGGRFATAVHVGPYEEIALTTHKLLAWAADHGYPVRGPLREVYVIAPGSAEPQRLVTRLEIELEDPS